MLPHPCSHPQSAHAWVYRLQSGSRTGPNEENEPVCTKIYYASRTHSQLAQVLHELRKLHIKLNVTTLPEPVLSQTEAVSTSNAMTKRPLEEEDSDQVTEEGSGSARTVSLASRKQLCINEDLRRRTNDIDEACRQLLGGESFPYSFRAVLLVASTDRFCRKGEASMSSSTPTRG